MLEDLLSGVEPSGDPDKFQAVYQIPYLAHATMEPMVSVADVRADGCDVWAPTQDRQQARSAVTSLVDLPPEAVHIHVPLIGGAFGRKHSPDVVREAVTVSLAVGAPVKIIWTRSEDMQHDLYHPLSLNPRSIAKEDPHRPPRGGSWAYGATALGVRRNLPTPSGTNASRMRSPLPSARTRSNIACKSTPNQSGKVCCVWLPKKRAGEHRCPKVGDAGSPFTRLLV
jgi:hypothetical protein